MQMFFACHDDRIMFFDILRDNIRLLLGSDEIINDTFISEFIKYLEYIYIYEWNYEDAELNECYDGITNFSKNGMTAIKMKGNKGYTGDKNTIHKLFSHELWHAIITVLNYMNSSDYERVINYSNIQLKINNYSGFYLCHDNKDFMVGYLLHECMVDILSHITCNLKTDQYYNIDDDFYYGIDDKSMDAPYDDYLTLCQLFIAAFNLDSNNTFQKNYLKGRGILGNYISKNDKKVIANLYIEGTLKNPITIMDEYDKYMGVGSYILMLKDIDILYDKYTNNKKVNTKILYTVCDNLSEFVNKRLNYYLDNNYIIKEEYDILFNNFLEILEVFKLEIVNYENKHPSLIKLLVSKFRR